jgi:hypothetical protein
MRINLIVSLLFVGAVATAGCSVSTETEEETESTSEELSKAVLEKLVGTWDNDVGSSKLPALTLDPSRTYSWESPGNVFENGRWSTYTEYGTRFVKLNPSKRGVPSKTYRLQERDNKPSKLHGAKGTRGTFVKHITGCELIDCAPGFLCKHEDKSKDAVCEPFATCAATLCKVGTICVDGNGTRPAQCIKNRCETIRCAQGFKCEPDPANGDPCRPMLKCESTLCAANSVCVDHFPYDDARCVPLECPAPGTTINCMPIVPEENIDRCAPAFRNWAQESCPGVTYLD